MAQSYHVWQVGENDATAKQVALDFLNGLVIVTVIGTMTFGIVLLYKYRCMKVLIGYMMFSSMTLLGVLGAELFNVAIEKYRIPIDWFTFVFGMFNFAVVGVIAIFYATGIPPYVTQAYLICSSVIISWQLSHFDTISTWTLLIMLGLYDLCAVLTPCGPLRALVNLMSDDDAPEMPGLLYEAEIPEGLRRPVMSGRHASGRDGDAEEDDDGSRPGDYPPSSMVADRYQNPSVQNSVNDNHIGLGHTSSDSTASGDVEMSSNNMSVDKEGTSTDELADRTETTVPNVDRGRSDDSPKPSASNSVSPERPPAPTAMIPFAIAKLYKLSLTSPPRFASPSTARENSGIGRQSGNISTSPLLKSDSQAEGEDSSSNPSDDETRSDLPAPYAIPAGDYTPAQMRTVVEAILPSNGAKILKQPRSGKEIKYGVVGSDGTLKRILFVDRSNGKVYEEMQDDDDSDEGRYSNTIKLGLGDFIFYSVLVAKSAQYSFPCFISSFLVILAGLGGTLVLLAVFKHALPALPISIFLAVGFYVMVRFVAEPWIHAVMNTPFYV